MADLSGKKTVNFAALCSIVNVSVPLIGKRHSTNQNEIVVKK